MLNHSLGSQPYDPQRDRGHLSAGEIEEFKQIEVLKWLLSEQMGRDCGWAYAEWTWNMRHRHLWLAKKRGAP